MIELDVLPDVVVKTRGNPGCPVCDTDASIVKFTDHARAQIVEQGWLASHRIDSCLVRLLIMMRFSPPRYPTLPVAVASFLSPIWSRNPADNLRMAVIVIFRIPLSA